MSEPVLDPFEALREKILDEHDTAHEKIDNKVSFSPLSAAVGATLARRKKRAALEASLPVPELADVPAYSYSPFVPLQIMREVLSYAPIPGRLAWLTAYRHREWFLLANTKYVLNEGNVNPVNIAQYHTPYFYNADIQGIEGTYTTDFIRFEPMMTPFVSPLADSGSSIHGGTQRTLIRSLPTLDPLIPDYEYRDSVGLRGTIGLAYYVPDTFRYFDTCALDAYRQLIDADYLPNYGFRSPILEPSILARAHLPFIHRVVGLDPDDSGGVAGGVAGPEDVEPGDLKVPDLPSPTRSKTITGTLLGDFAVPQIIGAHRDRSAVPVRRSLTPPRLPLTWQLAQDFLHDDVGLTGDLTADLNQSRILTWNNIAWYPTAFTASIFRFFDSPPLNIDEASGVTITPVELLLDGRAPVDSIGDDLTLVQLWLQWHAPRSQDPLGSPELLEERYLPTLLSGFNSTMLSLIDEDGPIGTRRQVDFPLSRPFDVGVHVNPRDPNFAFYAFSFLVEQPVGDVDDLVYNEAVTNWIPYLLRPEVEETSITSWLAPEFKRDPIAVALEDRNISLAGGKSNILQRKSSLFDAGVITDQTAYNNSVPYASYASSVNWNQAPFLARSSSRSYRSVLFAINLIPSLESTLHLWLDQSVNNSLNSLIYDRVYRDHGYLMLTVYYSDTGVAINERSLVQLPISVSRFEEVLNPSLTHWSSDQDSTPNSLPSDGLSFNVPLDHLSYRIALLDGEIFRLRRLLNEISWYNTTSLYAGVDLVHHGSGPLFKASNASRPVYLTQPTSADFPSLLENLPFTVAI